jgi:NADPH:quinone reductase-like Zn-dependent oxidoreductase
MRALHVPASGQQPRLSDLPMPTPGEGEVLIRVRAAALNPLDHSIAIGRLAGVFPHEYPLVLGRDAAGTVTAVGPNAAGVAVGDDVIAHIPLAPPVRAGTLAEYAVIPAASVATRPAELDPVTAAAIPLAGGAALAAADATAAQPGQTVLVVGAAGGVGSYAVQLLAARGATVLATGTAEDTERLTRLGAATVVDHTAAPVTDQISASHPGGVEALIDLVTHSPDALPLTIVRPGGRVVSTLGAAQEEALGPVGLAGFNIFAAPDAELIGRIAAEAAAGRLTVDVQAVLPLDDAIHGLAAIAAGRGRGKTVIALD